jgi:hypothetical protein
MLADTATRDIFLNGMSAGSLLAAKALANKFPWRDFRTVIDIGTAQGCVPVEIARVHPHLTGVVSTCRQSNRALQATWTSSDYRSVSVSIPEISLPVRCPAPKSLSWDASCTTGTFQRENC